VQRLITAFKYLTVWGDFAANPPVSEIVGRAVPYFPLVGLILGLLLVSSNQILAPHLDPQIITVILVALWAAVTGGRHLGGLKETFDSSGTSIMPDGSPKAAGMVAMVVTLMMKSASINSMDEYLTLSLLITPVLARWALSVFLFGYNTRFTETARSISEQVKFWPMLSSTIGTLALAVYLLGRSGLWVAMILSLFSLILRSLLFRRNTVLSQPNLGATVELAEALSLVLFASF
jgi:adenosylcobinamide-GDP ribazoletransferase